MKASSAFHIKHEILSEMNQGILAKYIWELHDLIQFRNKKAKLSILINMF